MNTDLQFRSPAIFFVQRNKFFTKYLYLQYLYIIVYRNSHPEVLCGEKVLKHFAKFTGNHLSQCPFFDKVAGLSNFIKKETLAHVFLSEFCEIFTSIFFIDRLR